MLEHLDVVSPLEDMGLSTEFETKVDQRQLEGTRPRVRQGFCVPASAGPRHSWWCWNRCCVLLTSDPKILGVLGRLRVGESFGDHGNVP